VFTVIQLGPIAWKATMLICSWMWRSSANQMSDVD